MSAYSTNMDTFMV
jgi:hypothetical protein